MTTKDPRADFYRAMMTQDKRDTYALSLRALANAETDPVKADVLNWVAANYERRIDDGNTDAMGRGTAKRYRLFRQ